MSRNLNAQEKPTIAKQKCVSCTCRDCKMGNSFLVCFKDTASVARELKVRWLLEKAGGKKKKTVGVPFSKKSISGLFNPGFCKVLGSSPRNV